MADPFSHPHFSDWSPPAGWQAQGSSAPEVEVWGPPSAEEGDEAARGFACPQCGAATAFDPSAGALRCGHCGYQAHQGDAGAAELGEFTAAALAASERGWGVSRQALHCETCGADIAVEAGQLATSCPFCASNQVDLRAVTDGALRPQQVLPFSLSLPDVGPLATAWLGKGWKRPSNLQKVARVERFSAVYLPWWLFDARLEIDWECEVGITTTSTYTDSAGRTRTRTTTKWHWENGHLVQAYDKVRVGGTSKVPGLERVGPYPMEQLRPYDPALLAGFGAHAYDISLPVAWDQGRHTMRTWAADACKGAAGGDRHRNLTLSADLQDEAWTYALMPAFVSAYTFRGRTWVVLVNGATGEVGGQRPVAWWKVYLAISTMLAPGLFIGVCLGLPGLLFAGIGIAFLIISAVLLLLGFIGSVLTYTSATAEERL